MKILYLSLDPRIPIDVPTGNAIRTLGTIDGLRELGHDVRLFAYQSGKTGDIVGSFGSGGRSIKSLVPKPLWILARDAYDVYRDFRSIPGIMDIVDEYGPDIIYDASAYLKDAGAAVARKRKIPYFLEINAPMLEERKKNFGAPLGGYHMRKEMARARFSNGVIVVSGVLKEYLVRNGVAAENIGVFHNGIDPKRFGGGTGDGKTMRDGLGSAGPVVGFVGAIAPYHGMDRLFGAAKKLKDKYPSILFWIIGQAHELDTLKDTAAKLGIENNVRFEGMVDPAKVPEYMAAFDMALLPSTAYYCSPVKIFEYAAAGLPMVAPRTAPVEEVFGDIESAVLVGADADLADAVDRVLADPERARAMASEMRRRVMSRYTWLKIARGMVEFFNDRLK